MQIVDLLSHGQENAIPLRQIAGLTNIDERTIREKIAAERLSGVPILSDNKTGYFLPANEKEKERFVQNMKHRAKEIERAAKAVEKSTYEKGI
jgi:HTH domain|nr:MAG TPA: PURINE OPERON REPRESSOR OPERON REPRESSOR, HELIX-TURN-HELIX DOMAIN [Caudoviricetes sp.]